MSSFKPTLTFCSLCIPSCAFICSVYIMCWFFTNGVSAKRTCFWHFRMPSVPIDISLRYPYCHLPQYQSQCRSYNHYRWVVIFSWCTLIGFIGEFQVNWQEHSRLHPRKNSLYRDQNRLWERLALGHRTRGQSSAPTRRHGVPPAGGGAGLFWVLEGRSNTTPLLMCLLVHICIICIQYQTRKILSLHHACLLASFCISNHVTIFCCLLMPPALVQKKVFQVNWRARIYPRLEIIDSSYGIHIPVIEIRVLWRTSWLWCQRLRVRTWSLVNIIK